MGLLLKRNNQNRWEAVSKGTRGLNSKVSRYEVFRVPKEFGTWTHRMPKVWRGDAASPDHESFNRLSYNEKSGQVRMRLKRERIKVFSHAIDFLAALSRHVPRKRQQTVAYAAHHTILITIYICQTLVSGL